MAHDCGIRLGVLDRRAGNRQHYNYYVTETIVTFEEEPIPAVEMTRRLEQVRLASLPWLVEEADGRLAGFACATRRAGVRVPILPYRTATRASRLARISCQVELGPDRVPPPPPAIAAGRRSAVAARAPM